MCKYIIKEDVRDRDTCDICEKHKSVLVAWPCRNDDPAHWTQICINCLKLVLNNAEASI